MWLQGWGLLTEKNHNGQGRFLTTKPRLKMKAEGCVGQFLQKTRTTSSCNLCPSKWVTWDGSVRKPSLDLAKSEHVWSAWLLSWWNDSSCVHKVAPVRSVRLSALSPAAFLPRSWGTTGLDKIIRWVKNWLGHCYFSNQRLCVQLLTCIKERVLGIVRELVLLGVWSSDQHDETQHSCSWHWTRMNHGSIECWRSSTDTSRAKDDPYI